MRISVDINGYYDWVPAPPGTEVTKHDVAALRAKMMTDDKWHIRVPMDCKDKPSHHDMGIHEEMVCGRLAALEKLGRSESREQVIAYMMQSSFTHHLSPKHMIKINIHDDGPNAEMMKEAMANVGLEGSEADAVLEKYMDTSTDMESYLNVVFKTAAAKKKV